MEPIARGIARLMAEERQVMLVSSGAVGLGRSLLGLHPSRLKDMAVKQACAAAGQSLLMESYKRVFDALRAESSAGSVDRGGFQQLEPVLQSAPHDGKTAGVRCAADRE